MSSILDALKKSEAERQRGQPPTLNTPILPTRQAPQRRRPAWLLPAVAGLALVAAWAGGLFSSGEGDGTAPETAEAVPAEAPAVAEAPATAGAPAMRPPGSDTETAAADGAAEEGGAAPPVRQIGFGPYPPRRTAPAEDGAPKDAAPDASRDAVAAAPVAAETPPAPADPALPSSPSAAPGDGNPSGATAVAAVPDITPPPQAAPDPANPAGDARAPAAGVPSMHQLPFAVRREMPPLSMTLHMYSSDPERRFAIINGTRVEDGSELDGGFEVRQIQPDGVLMHYKGTDFVLPARG